MKIKKINYNHFQMIILKKKPFNVSLAPNVTLADNKI